MTTQRNEAIGQMEEQKHKVTLLQEHMTDLKIKLSRYLQEKMQSERHLQHLKMHQQRGTGDGGSNATTALITPQNGTTTSTIADTEYYQRKCSESNQKVLSYQAMMIEKNRQIDELRYQLERNMNQQQYTHLQRQQGAMGGLENQPPHSRTMTGTTTTLPSSSLQQQSMDSTLLSKRQRM